LAFATLVAAGFDLLLDEAQMNRDCAEGFRLRKRFEGELKKWGWFDAFEKAVEIMPVGLSKVHEFQMQVNSSYSALQNARHAYSEHMATCLKCSRRLVTPDAIPTIYERLENDCKQHAQ
jgi:hypothetical protein